MRTRNSLSHKTASRHWKRAMYKNSLNASEKEIEAELNTILQENTVQLHSDRITMRLFLTSIILCLTYLIFLLIYGVMVISESTPVPLKLLLTPPGM